MYDVFAIILSSAIGAAIALLVVYLAPGDAYGPFQSYAEIERDRIEVLKRWRLIALAGAIFGVTLLFTAR